MIWCFSISSRVFQWYIISLKPECDSTKSIVLHFRASLASRLASTSGEVKGISRKEFKPTIPTRRKKPGNQPKQDNPGLATAVDSRPASSDSSERFKNRVDNPKQKEVSGIFGDQQPTKPTNQSSLFMSRDWSSANQGPVIPGSVGSCC